VIEELVGTTAIDTSVGAVTVSVSAGLAMLPSVATILLAPAATPVAKPLPEMVATVPFEEVQVTLFVRFCVLALLYVPVAMNCCVAPLVIDGFTGVTAIEFSVGGVTVSVVEPLIVPSVAPILVVPAVAPVASPPEEMVATLLLLELQATAEVKFLVPPPLKWPVAANCNVLPAAIEGSAGVTVIEVRPVSLPVPLSATRVGLPKA
jgi:hypothetical protein